MMPWRSIKHLLASLQTCLSCILQIKSDSHVCKPCMQTRSWLCAQAERLVRDRKLLERELTKFMHVTAVRERCAPVHSYFQQ